MTESKHHSFAFSVLCVVHIYQCVLEMSLRHPGTRGRSQGRSGLSGNIASGREKGWNVFWLQQVDNSRRKQKNKPKKTKRNQARSLFSLHHHSQHNLLTFSHLIAFPFLATNSATLYFHHLTHIQNCFLVGAVPETKSKPLIQLQIIGWKAVTSALDRTASHGSSSSPSLDGTLFLFFILITFTNPLSYDELILPSHQLWNWLLCEHKHLKSNIIVVK